MRYLLILTLFLGGCCGKQTVGHRTSCLFPSVRSSTRESGEGTSKQSENHWRLTNAVD